MGYVGAYTYAEVISGYTSFFLGARSVCPSVTMEVTFTGSWYDETAEKEQQIDTVGLKSPLVQRDKKTVNCTDKSQNNKRNG